MLRENPANEVAVGLLSFLIVWISDAVNIFYSIQTRNSCTCHMHEERHLSNIWYFFKKSWFHYDGFSRVTFPFKCGKAISWWSRRLQSHASDLPMKTRAHTRQYLLRCAKYVLIARAIWRINSMPILQQIWSVILLQIIHF